MNFNGLSTVNIELSSRCNKQCFMCGRRKIDKDFPEIAMDYGDMDSHLIVKIEDQLPENIVVQFHNNGESLLYPRFGQAVSIFDTQIKCLDTNGKLLIEKADEIIDNLDTLTISVIENDPEGDEQYSTVEEFLIIKGNRKPLMIYRLLGEIEDRKKWESLPGIIANRVLHDSLGSRNYKKEPTKPEIGICLDLLNHLVIDRHGFVSPCIRFDPYHVGRIGNVNDSSLFDIWNGEERKRWIDCHLQGLRNMVALCSRCDYWGVPTG